MLSASEWSSLVPFVALSAVYWSRDRYLYNRGGATLCSASRVQWQVLCFLYPLWAFLEWSHGLQVSRNAWWYIAFVTPGRTWLGHTTAVFVINDGFFVTRQQLVAFGFSLALAYTWAAVGTLMFSKDERAQVGCVCNETAR
jgi:hypothetical protein